MAGIKTLTVSATPSPGYTVAVVAERLGVPKGTLRSWSQRYGLGPRGHLRGRHRLYSEADIAVLSQMLHMVQTGVTPASAAECVRSQLGVGETSANDDVAELIRLALQLDTAAISELLDRSLHVRGVIATWNDVCRPVFANIEERQLESRCIDAEHAFSWALSGRLRHVIYEGSIRRSGAPKQATIVLACTPAERHLLPLEALAASLAESSTPVRMLGSDVPLAALQDALDYIRPEVLVLWSQVGETADVDAIGIGVQFAERLYLAGPGWGDYGLPEGVRRLTDLEQASETLHRSEALHVH